MPLVSKNQNENNVKDEEESKGTSNFVPVQNSNKNKKPALEYNNKNELSYIEQGLTPPDNLNQQERNFLSKVDPKVEPIIRTVTKIVRLMAIDYNSPNKERKEYIMYYENWFGRDWLKRIVPPVTDHIEGRYDMILTEPVYDKNEEELIGYKRSGKRQVYYIPFSKEKVDEIITNSMGSDKKETIKFLFSNEPLGYEFPYEEFVNRSYDELATMLFIPGGPKPLLQKKEFQKFLKEEEQQSL